MAKWQVVISSEAIVPAGCAGNTPPPASLPPQPLKKVDVDTAKKITAASLPHCPPVCRAARRKKSLIAAIISAVRELHTHTHTHTT